MSPTSTEQNEVKPPSTTHTVEVEDTSEATGRSLFQRNPAVKYLLIIGLVVVLVAVGWFWWDSRRWESTDDAQIDGYIYPISARVGGQVVKVTVDDGAFVHKGDVLVQIDSTDYKVAVDRAQADLQDAQANFLAAQAGVPIADISSSTQIHSTSADVTGAQA
ncbi:MAG TPA: biotin/lipoyl-binding protein, partial [Candidatus Angelobacter sp.]|nr:biotin/lipoyl-binding protein [Candidatus Angelobacter sp.]